MIMVIPMLSNYSIMRIMILVFISILNKIGLNINVYSIVSDIPLSNILYKIIKYFDPENLSIIR